MSKKQKTINAMAISQGIYGGVMRSEGERLGQVPEHLFSSRWMIDLDKTPTDKIRRHEQFYSPRGVNEAQRREAVEAEIRAAMGPSQAQAERMMKQLEKRMEEMQHAGTEKAQVEEPVGDEGQADLFEGAEEGDGAAEEPAATPRARRRRSGGAS